MPNREDSAESLVTAVKWACDLPGIDDRSLCILNLPVNGIHA
jgi:hypothetical protein